MQQSQQAWEQVYRNGSQLSTWPWTAVISLTHNYFQEVQKPRRVLELGCGAGANIPFFVSLGWQYCAVEYSDTMCRQLRERWAGQAVDIVCGDFTRELPFEGSFDLVLDRSALTHNDTESIRRCLKLVQGLLKAGQGLMFSLDWFADEWISSLSDRRTTVDEHTCQFEEGYFKGLGNVHKASGGHLRELFSDFELLVLQETTVRQLLPTAGIKLMHLNLVARAR